MASSSSSSSGSSSPCAACKFLRRKCTGECVFAPYFPPDQPQKFASVHKIFGASNITKLLNELPVHKREDAVNSLAYEADARIKDPVYGCVGAISALQRQLLQLQEELTIARSDLASVSSGGALLQHQQHHHQQQQQQHQEQVVAMMRLMQGGGELNPINYSNPAGLVAQREQQQLLAELHQQVSLANISSYEARLAVALGLPTVNSQPPFLISPSLPSRSGSEGGTSSSGSGTQLGQI